MNMKFLCLAVFFITFEVVAQQKKEVFSEKSGEISRNIDFISKTQKDSLRMEVQKLDSLYKNGKLTKLEWERKKLEQAEFRAKRIEELVSKEDEKLLNLTKGLVTGDVVLYQPYKSLFKKIRINGLIRFGLNTLSQNGNISNEIKNFKSYFMEWGANAQFSLTDSHKLTGRAGFSVVYNNLYPISGKYFKKEGEQTLLVPTRDEISKNRFKNVYLTFPFHLEYDFGKKSRAEYGDYYFEKNSIYIGIGGFIGTHLKTKNFFQKGDDRILQKYNFNTSNFVYGLSGYIGYHEVSLYFKYDLNPLFKNNDEKQHMFSIGLQLGY
ncbi:hypothetical protein [Capnocytophaga cynodegmi]|uniref:hypothetical protein n=1 Tax=Capnocytophaga cynodegmi TaxID=28189 RepID=UPI00385B76E8